MKIRGAYFSERGLIEIDRLTSSHLRGLSCGRYLSRGSNMMCPYWLMVVINLTLFFVAWWLAMRGD